MPWIRIGDEFVDDPAIVDLGEDEAIAGWTYLRLVSYAARHLTDGYLPSKVVGREDPIGVACLLRSALLERVPDRYFLPRFLTDHHPPREATLRLRAQRAEAGRRGARQTNSASAAASAASVDAASSSARRTPRPVPSRPVSRYPHPAPHPVPTHIGDQQFEVDRV